MHSRKRYSLQWNRKLVFKIQPHKHKHFSLKRNAELLQRLPRRFVRRRMESNPVGRWVASAVLEPLLLKLPLRRVLRLLSSERTSRQVTVSQCSRRKRSSAAILVLSNSNQTQVPNTNKNGSNLYKIFKTFKTIDKLGRWFGFLQLLCGSPSWPRWRCSNSLWESRCWRTRRRPE